MNKKLQGRYDRIATKWNSEAYKGTRQDELISKLIAAGEMINGQSVLEAMCGTGLLATEIKNQFPHDRVVGLDFSEGMLSVVPEQIEKIKASIIDIPCEDQSFDRIFIRSAIYDLPRSMQSGAFAEIKRVLKKEGIFILQTYVTTAETQEYLNELVNLRDKAADQFEMTGGELPRYFATSQEIEEWMSGAGFLVERVETFKGTIRYLISANEMTENGAAQWIDYAESLPENIKEKINMRLEQDGNLVFDFSGMIYKLTV